MRWNGNQIGRGAVGHRRRVEGPARRRGVALMIVVGLLAVVAVLGMAMLSTASLQGLVAEGTTRSAQAQYLAESGANAAMYYLYYPAAAPAG